MGSFLLSQVVAAIAFACGAISFQWKARRSMLLSLSGSAVANACHFFILGRAAPGTLFLVMGARSLAAAFSVNRKIMYLFFGLIVAGFVFSYEHPIEFLGLFATLSATYGSFQNTAQRVRVIMMLSNVSWMTHNVVVGTPVAAIMEGTFLASNVLGYWRYRRRDEAAPGRELSVTEERTE
jgi:uncharacterized membrane protein